MEVRYLKAEESIKILELNLETVDSQASTIIKAMELNPKLSVQILTLNPFSKFAENRANQLAELPLIYRRRLYQTIESTYNKLNTISQKRWEIRIYDTFPTQIMFQIDKALINSIISLGRRSRDMLHFEVQASRPNASDTFEAHFAQLWSQGVDYKEWFKRNRKDVVDLLETGNSESTHMQRRQRISQNNKIIKKA